MIDRKAVAVLVLAALATGCASNLLVAAPRELPPLGASPLSALSPLRVSLGTVTGAPGLDAAVGQIAAGPLQPGGPIRLTEDAGTIVARVLRQTLERAGHQVVAAGSQVHVTARVDEFRVDAPRVGAGWEVTARVKLALRVRRRAGSEAFDELSSRAERSQEFPLRPGIGTVEPVLAGCLEALSELLARRPELPAALAQHAGRSGP